MRRMHYLKKYWDQCVNRQEGYVPNRIELALAHDSGLAVHKVVEKDYVITSSGVCVLVGFEGQLIKIKTILETIEE